MATTNIFDTMTMERDHLELSLGDTLDVKGGILLAVITILGALTGALLTSPNLGRYSHIGQLISLALLVLGCIFAIIVMLPREYLLPDLPGKYKQWIDELKEFYKDDPNRLESETTNGMTRVANERIEINHKINAEKSYYLNLSFWPTLLALAIDISTLAVLGMSRILS